jgi:hypothetical protein
MLFDDIAESAELLEQVRREILIVERTYNMLLGAARDTAFGSARRWPVRGSSWRRPIIEAPQPAITDPPKRCAFGSARPICRASSAASLPIGLSRRS